MLTSDELEAKLVAAERELDVLTAEVKRNDDKLRRSQKRELQLLQAPSLDALFQEMIDGLEDSYGLQHVGVTLCDPSHDVRHLLLSSPKGLHRRLQLVDTLSGLAPQYVALRKPWLGPYTACDHQLVFDDAKGIRSVAMIPLWHREELVGSINLGSSDPERFTRHHASDFLAHLGVIASFALENSVNRARLRRSGFTDVLTGWYNRRYLQARLKEEFARARRDQTNLICMMLDIDHFKRVNDRFGHAAGDQVLCELAHRIDSQIRASDVAVRYGGEEFVILLPDTDTQSGIKLAERIRAAVAATPFILPGGETERITVSIGIAGIMPGKDEDDFKTLGDALIARADVALYGAKAAGRNRVTVEEAA